VRVDLAGTGSITSLVRPSLASVNLPFTKFCSVRSVISSLHPADVFACGLSRFSAILMTSFAEADYLHK
jgi:hypothetical protein